VKNAWDTRNFDPYE